MQFESIVGPAAFTFLALNLGMVGWMLIAAIGGLAGYWLVDLLSAYLPFFLVAASSSFVYVALADLIPQLQKRLSARETAAQILWLGVGIGMVAWMLIRIVVVPLISSVGMGMAAAMRWPSRISTVGMGIATSMVFRTVRRPTMRTVGMGIEASMVAPGTGRPWMSTTRPRTTKGSPLPSRQMLAPLG